MTRYFPDDDHIDRLARGVIALAWPKPQWTHAAHFALALWMLRRRPSGEVAAALPDIIRAYNRATGVENTDHAGYHQTITLASIAAAAAFLAAQGAVRPLHEILDDLMATELGASDWPLAYWTRPALFSVEARRRWVEPDIKPFPAAAL
jgi:hypothetical protein